MKANNGTIQRGRGGGGPQQREAIHGSLYDEGQMHYYERRDNGSHIPI